MSLDNKIMAKMKCQRNKSLNKNLKGYTVSMEPLVKLDISEIRYNSNL